MAEQPPPVPTPIIPYATPVAAPVPAGVEAAWQDGPVLVVRKGVVLPPRCVKCGDVADGSYLKRNLHWHSPLLYFLILFPGLIVYAIVATVVLQKGTVAVHLCANHRRRRTTIIWTSWALLFAGMAALFDAAVSENKWLTLAGVVLLLAAFVVACSFPLVRARRIDTHFMWLNGAGAAFLRALPSLPTRW